MVSHPLKYDLQSRTSVVPSAGCSKALSDLQLLDGVVCDPTFWDLVSYFFAI